VNKLVWVLLMPIVALAFLFLNPIRFIGFAGEAFYKKLILKHLDHLKTVEIGLLISNQFFYNSI
jgi:hypothetical protein